MGKREIDDFSEDSIAEIAKTVRTLRWQVQNVQEMSRRLSRHAPTHEIRTGLTKAKTGETYPTTGCVFPVQFQDADFDETTGQCVDLVRHPWGKKFVVARVYSGKYIAADKDVLIVKVASKKGRRWWILDPPETCDFVEFKILSTGTNARGIRWAKVEILSRPCGCLEVPEEVELIVTQPSTLGPGIEKVYDLKGCLLNEPDVDLVDRLGSAKYVQDLRFIQSPMEPGGPVPDCTWSIQTLCCPTCDSPAAASAAQSSGGQPAAMITGSGPGVIPGQFLP